MFRAIPTNNKLCFDKQLKRSWKIHEQKLKTIKSSINRSSPQHYQFLDQRPKKAALQDIRNIQIEKQNFSLMNKIKDIGEKGSKSSYLKNGNGCQKKKTLNQGYRKRQLVKIVQENQDIIKRIQSKKSMYNVKKWGQQRKQIQKNISLISGFQYKNYPCTQTKVNLWMTGGQDESKKQKIGNLSLSKSRLKKSDLQYSGTHKIGQQYYLIQTNIRDKIFTIQIENLQRMTQKYKLQISQKEAFQMIDTSFSGDLRNLFPHLEINQQQGTCQLKCYKPQIQSQSKQMGHKMIQ